jgi:hypothetical protein
MLITINTQTFHLEAVPAASALPCWYGVDAKRRLDTTRALAGRRAR